MIIKIEGNCQYRDCNKPAEFIAKGKIRYDEYKNHPELGVFCADHASIVEDEGNPEYIEECPNCKCRFGVN